MPDTRITELFARLKRDGRKGFIAYITAGDPTPDRTPALVDALDFSLSAGLMPAQMKQVLVNAVTTETGGNVARIETGIYLILSSGYYNVWH